MGSRLVRFVLALAVSVAFVWLAFRDLDIEAVLASLDALGRFFGLVEEAK